MFVSSSAREMSNQTSWNILADQQGIKINEKFVLKLTKGSKNINKEVKDSCKILHFSPEWNFEEVLMTIDGLDPKEYPQTFIFIIETINFKITKFIPQKFSWFKFQESKHENVRKLKENCTKFGTGRPIILQLTSVDENITKFYYKEETSNQFIVIDHQQDESKYSSVFSSFLVSFFNGKFNNSEIEFLNVVREFENCSLVLRFLQTLQLSVGFFGSLVLDVASEGSKSEFVATLDSPFDSNGRVLSYRRQKYISDVFGDDDDPDNDTSVLLRAIENENTDVIDYLITYWTHLIQQLPLDHQVKISTAAFKTNQLDGLCDLLDIADYPFPDNFEPETIEHARLHKITAERNDFKAAIEAKDFDKIDEFIKNNSNLKFIHMSSNNSALTEAINLRKFGVFYYLKSLNFKGEKCDDILAKLSKEEKEEAVKLATDRRKENVTKSEDVAPRSVMLLSMRSSVHNSRTEKIQASKYREKIMSLFIDIHKVAPELIDVAASCNNLKIIFDFESDSVESMSLTGSNAAGSTYSSLKWIFVGAKLSDKNSNVTKQREQKIKGVLAHELCHYVMRLVYDNQENPYYKDSEYMKEMFKEVVKIIDQWSSEDSECPDDKCNGIISSVFRLYDPKDFHPELIVRVVQILSEFDDSEDKLKHLEEKYEVFFDFWHGQVIPELENYLLKNQEVIKLNRLTRLLHCILEHEIEIKPEKDIDKLVDSKLVIVTSNQSKVLFIDICKNLKKKNGNLMNSKNLFIKLENLTNPQIWDQFKQICSDIQQLSIFIDCTKGTSEHLGNIFMNKELNFIFLASNQSQSEELSKYCVSKGMNDSTQLEINYSWSDLTEESQNLLLQTKVNFQNNSQISLKDLLNNEEPEGYETYEIIDDQILKMLIENHEIIINTKFEQNFNEEKLIYQARRFQKKQNNKKNQANVIKISQDELLLEVKDQLYVLISDQAGNGKSWAMKNLTRLLREQNPTSWVTYVDLKQFINEFKACKGEPEFSTFMVEKILKLKSKFEAKIFQKLYKNGKVFILFDGFDEIAPDCAEFVSKLAQKFDYNNGNQLWIATRDYFEVDLKEKLKLNVAYCLDEMTEEEGINIIAKIWMLIDLEMDKNEPKSKEEFDENSKMSPKYEGYQERARQIIKKAAVAKFRTVGLPQMFKMIADGFKGVNDVDELHGPKIYIKFIKILYKRWSEQKGPIRNEASIDSQEFEMTFYKFHQYQAILSLFPKLANVLFPDYDGSEWSNEEIIACALMTIIDGKIFFLHKTFCEFFIADFIAKNLKKSKIQDQVIDIFVEVLTVDKFEVIRMFLNDMLDDDSNLQRITPEIQKHIEKFIIMTSFADFFTRNLTNLVDLVLKVLKNGDKQKVKSIINENVKRITANTSDSAIFKKFQDFIFDILSVFDIKLLIVLKEIFQNMILSSLEIETFEDFVLKIEEIHKAGRRLIKDGLMLVNEDYWKGNIFCFLGQSSNLNAHKVQKFLEIIKKYLTADEIFELMNKCTGFEQSILQDCIDSKKSKNLKILWIEIEKFFKAQKFEKTFKEFIKQHDKHHLNVLHSAAMCDDIEVNETLWELLLKTFEDRDELMKFILENNFLHQHVRVDPKPAIIKLTFEILKENFSKTQLEKLLDSKDEHGLNLIQYAAFFSTNIKTQQLCWEYFRYFCETDKKFLEILKEVHKERQNILHIAARNISIEVLEFMIQELEKIASRDEIREMLRPIESEIQNVLQTAAEAVRQDDTVEILRKYF